MNNTWWLPSWLLNSQKDEILLPEELPKIRLTFGGVKYNYIPQPDITAFEVAIISNMLTIGLRQPANTSFSKAFENIVREHDLQRHFIPLGETK